MTPDQPNKPTIDERLQALAESLELLTRDIHEMQAAMRQHDERMRQLDARERRAREALLTGIAAYLRALNEDDGQQT